jgi:uroporphyrinogen decarboxylase
MADLLGSDFRHVNIGGARGYQSWTDENGNHIDEWGIGRSLMGQYPTIVKNPLADMDIGRLKAYVFPDPDDPGRFEGLAERARDYFENTDKAVTACSASSGQVFDLGQYLLGTENFLVGLYTEPAYMELLIDKLTDYLLRLNLNYLEPIAPYIEWVEFSSDFGAQNAPFISVDMFREWFAPSYSKLFGAIKHRWPHMKIFLHSCGSVFDLIDEFIECGVDIINPLQPLTYKMESEKIKERYGGRVIFHGAIDIQQAINGSIEDVRAEVRRRIDALGAGGGYILSPANHIQDTTPPENVLELFSYAQEYGRY